MNISEILVVLRTYPAFDIDKTDGTSLRKQLLVDDNTEELLTSYLKMHGTLRIYPKRKQGSAFMRDESAIMELGAPLNRKNGLGGFNTYPQNSAPSGTADMYKIMWESERENARDWKTKYENTLNDLRKLEVEHAGSKNSAMGDIMSGLAGVLPAMMGGGAASPTALGSTHAQLQNQPSLQPVKDKRLLGIVTFYNKLDEDSKTKVYTLLTKVFQNMDKIDELTELIGD